MSEGGRHLDASIIKSIGAIIEGLASILKAGRQARQFREVHPVIVQMGIIAPLLLFAASAPMRERFSALVHGAADVPRAALVAYLEEAALSALATRRPARATAPGDKPASKPKTTASRSTRK
jgi:hypothetical protein